MNDMSFYDVISELNINLENRLFTVCDGTHAGEKMIVSGGKLVWMSDKAGFFSVHASEAISAEAEKKQTEASILLEVNVAEESTKYGLSVSETAGLAEKIAVLPRVHIKGLMTVAPFVPDPEENRPVFRRLRQLSVDIDRQNIDNVSMSVLSMGMTNDFEIAIEEGATCVRVGTAIFGARDYSV